MGIVKKLPFVALLAVATLVLSSAGCGTQQAQFPSGTITMAIGFAAGSGADGAARALAEATQKNIGQPVVVQNAAGAGGATAAAQIVKAKPDGYNILFSTGSLVTQPFFEDVPYKPGEDLIPIIQVGGYPTMLVVKADSEYKTLKDFVEAAKKNPGKMNYSSSGYGSIHHVLAEMVWQKAGVQLTHVPFKSNVEGVVAMLGGNLSSALATSADVLTHLKEGRVRALGIFMPERYKEFPDVPTFKEQGYDVSSFGWWGVAGPKGLPDAVSQKLHDSFKKGIADTPFTTWMAENKYPIVYLNSQDSLAQWKRELAMYGEIAKTLKSSSK